MGTTAQSQMLTFLSLLGVTLALDVSIFTDDYFFPVVSDGETIKNFDARAHTHVEDEFQSITKFDIDAMEGETFSLPVIEIVGAETTEALFPEDDVLALEIDGDSLFVDLYRQEEEEYAYELAVIYKCFKTGSRDIKVTIPYSQVDQVDNFFYEANATFAWTKSCVAGQDRIGFSIVTEDDEAVVIDGVATDEWRADAPTNTVGPHDDSTRFYIGVNEGSQTYSAPKVTVSQPFLTVTVRGEASTANIVEFDDYDDYDDGEFQMLEVIYKCLTFGQAQLTLSYDVSPFNPITFGWKKDCGGGIKLGFDVATVDGTSAKPDVVNNAETQEAWHPDTHVAVVPKEEKSTTFFLRMTGAEEVTQFGKPIVTVKPAIFKPRLAGDLGEGGIVSAKVRTLEVIYNCRKKGSAEVTMTIVLPKYEMIEFSWEKECGARVITAPKVYTANQLMVLFTMSSISVIAVLVFVFLRFKKRRSEKERARLAALRAQEEVETY